MAKVKLSKAKTAIIIIAAISKAKNRRDYPLMYFMMTERMILICLQLIFQANIL